MKVQYRIKQNDLGATILERRYGGFFGTGWTWVSYFDSVEDAEEYIANRQKAYNWTTIKEVEFKA